MEITWCLELWKKILSRVIWMSNSMVLSVSIRLDHTFILQVEKWVSSGFHSFHPVWFINLSYHLVPLSMWIYYPGTRWKRANLTVSVLKRLSALLLSTCSSHKIRRVKSLVIHFMNFWPIWMDFCFI